MEKERLDELLKEIGRTPLLSADEEKALCKAEMEGRMRKLREFMENSTANKVAVPTVDFMRLFPYELWDEMKIKHKLKEYLDKGYDEEKAFSSIVRPWMNAVRQLLEFVTACD